MQYKAALAITGAIQATSRVEIHQELRLESLKSRRWYKRQSCMFKIMKKEALNYLINFVKQTPEQGTTVYLPSTDEQIV